jgi:ABC-type sugar transport system ATPase subunit
MFVHGSVYAPKTPKYAIDRGVVYFSEDRKGEGLILSMRVRENITLPVIDRFSHSGVIRKPEETAAASHMVEQVDLRPPEIEREVQTLSGGNQQKVVFAKGLLANADVLLLDEPTRGVDVGAKVELHHQIRDLADSGKAVLVISSELPEILALADRVVVLHEGKVTGCLEGNEMTNEAVIALAVAAA